MRISNQIDQLKKVYNLNRLEINVQWTPGTYQMAVIAYRASGPSVNFIAASADYDNLTTDMLVARLKEHLERTSWPTTR